MPLLFSSTLTLANSLFFTFFKTFQSLCLGVRFRVSVWVSVRVDVRVIFRVGVRLGLQLGLEFIFCLLRFCQARCRWHLGGKIDTAINLS